MSPRNFPPALLFLLSAHCAMAASIDEITTTLDDQTAVAVTIYNQDLALIRDQRQLSLPAGRVDLAFRDVSARIQPQTALLRAPSADRAQSLRVIEQNFDFDLLTPDKLLENYVGREVGLIRTHPTTGEETEETATVLAANDGVVLKLADRIETGRLSQFPYRLVYRDIPDTLRERPTLVMRLDNPNPAAQTLELSYLSAGLSWQADYVAELSADETRLDLTGWVTLDNRSGTSYPQAQLQLVAGEVNRASQPPDMMFNELAQKRLLAEAAAPMAEEALFEYHLYSLAEPTTIADNQSKQVSLLAATGVKVRKELLIQGDTGSYQRARGALAQDLDVQVFLELTNDTDSNLGLPLPAGTLRVYKQDRNGQAQFIGEDRIDHTPTHKQIRVLLGQSFDVTAERRQSEFTKRSGSGPWQYEYDSAFEVVVNNAKPEPVEVKLQERLPGDWKILEESAPHAQGNAQIAVWTLQVPAEGSTTLRYRARVRL